jgi:hypothetical protein
MRNACGVLFLERFARPSLATGKAFFAEISPLD